MTSLRDADQVIGHLQHYRYADGERRLRLALRTGYEPPEPWRHDVRRTVVEVVAGVVVLSMIVVGLVAWAWIAAAAQVQVPA